MAKKRARARIVYVATNGKQVILEGDFHRVAPGTEYEACMPLATHMRLALLTIQAAAQGLAVAGVQIITESVTPWSLLSWEVAQVGECK